MLQHEFEQLAGIKVNESTYEVINAMYMSDDNMDKETFVKYFKKMNLLNYAEGRAEYTTKLRQEKEEQTARAMQAERENEKLRKILDGEREAREMLSSKFKEEYEKLEGQYRDFAKTIAIQCHNYDESFIEGECCRALGDKEYFTTLRDAGCEPSRNDLDMMVKHMEEE